MLKMSSWLLVGSMLVGRAALAQEAIPKDVTADKVLAKPAEPTPDGWALKLSLGATGSYNHSKKVVGTVDGATQQYGLIVNGSANLTAGQHAWENALKITETQTRTPQLDKFIKSADELAFQTTYLYHFDGLDWVGPFARASVTTQLFASYDVKATDTTVVRTTRDGATITKTRVAEDRINMTKPFEPMLLKEGVGAYANPYNEKWLAVKTKLGAGLQEVVVGDGYTLDKYDAATNTMTLKQLEDSTQGGAEAELELGGALAENITYGAKATVFYPLYTSVETDLSGIDLMSTDLSAKLSVRLAKWASLDYVVSAKKVPLILNEWQIQNGVMLTAGFDLL